MRPVISILAFLFLQSTVAKAPVWEDSAPPKRVPAQSSSDLVLPKIDDYLDMNCHELTDESSKDEFIRYFTREAKVNYQNLCSLVKEDQEMDSEIAQSERESIGLGTFSRIVEGHFDEFILRKKLFFYQDLDCHTLMDGKNQDEFIRYVSSELKKDGGDLCGVDQGTKAKVVEIYFDAFNFL